MTHPLLVPQKFPRLPRTRQMPLIPPFALATSFQLIHYFHIRVAKSDILPCNEQR